MKHDKLALAIALTVGSLAFAGSAFAFVAYKLPPVETQGNIHYITGGIGSNEASAMLHVQSHYPLSLEFAERAKPRDEFLADIGVTIKSQAGNTTLKATSSGPFLFADVPAGKYTVIASDNGKKIIRHVAVAEGKPEHLVFVW